MLRIILFVWLFSLTLVSLAQNEHAFDINERLGRGVNYGNMFEAPTETAWGNPWQAEYPGIISELGFDHVRIPIRWETDARSEPTAPYAINPDFMARVKEVVDASLEEGLMVIINMHHHDSLYADPDDNKARFLAQWEQISNAFSDYSDSLLFEILNEPHGALVPEKWNTFLREALDVIRSSNPDRVVLIGTAEYGGLGGLSKLNLPDDPNIILSIHYYNPFPFTHQGAEWVGENADEWLGTEWNDTDVERAVVYSEFAPLIEISENQNVPINIGEFGAYSTADIESREKWTTFLARYFEEQGWSWAYWEFSAGFGFYDPANESLVSELVDALLHNEMPEPLTYKRTAIYQSDFSDGTDGWSLNTQGGATGNLTLDGGALHVNIDNAGTESWHVQLSKGNIQLDSGKTYAISFTGNTANDSRSLTWYAGMNAAPWSAYSSYNSATLSAASSTFTTTFDMQVTDTSARIVFDLGSTAENVHIEEIKVETLELSGGEVVLGVDGSEQVRVYPNPASDWLNVENTAGFRRLHVINLKGQKLMSKPLNDGLNTFELNQLTPGFYLLNLEDTNRSAMELIFVR